MLFINTRPQDRAEALTQALQQQHIEVIDLPLLQLSAQPWSEQLANLYAQLPHTHIIVVVSPTAVDIDAIFSPKPNIIAGFAAYTLGGCG